MSLLFRELVLPDELSKSYATDEHANRICKLSKLNVFIGPNNSGKSRLLRGLFQQKQLVFSPVSDDLERFRHLVTELREGLKGEFEEGDRPMVNALGPQVKAIYAPLSSERYVNYVPAALGAE